MGMSLTTLTLVVPDYDEAIEYFVSVLGFRLVEDTDLGDGKRWVVVTPAASPSSESAESSDSVDSIESAGRDNARLLLAKADSESQRAAIGNQTGGRVFLFLETTRFDEDYLRLVENGVNFIENPRDEPYGKVVVFVDRFGNQWDLIQRSDG